MDILYKMKLDSKDMEILEALKQDSRKPIKELSKITGIRPSTIHQRKQKLIENKIIEKFTVKLNNKEVGENFIVLMLVKGKATDYIDSKIINNNHVKEVFGVTGEYDLLMKLKFSDINDFNNFILDFRKNKNIQTTLTMVATANLKEEI